MTAAARTLTLPAFVALSVAGMEGCSPAGTSGDGDGDGDSGAGATDGSGGSGIDLGSGGSGADGIGGIENMPAPPNCGDGILQEDEACDDGNKEGGDGCLANCLAPEAGYICLVPGEPCKPFAKCGDGVLSFPETCDDGGVVTGDGCSDNCKEEIGYRCEGTPSVCSATVCGDGKQEGAEACEHPAASLVNGQPMPFGGCTVDFCQVEPDCSGFSCISPCGDGLRINEACDDGNTSDGDGCSSTCEIEEGYLCTSAPCEIYDPDGDGEGECMLRVPVIYRDFNSSFVDMLPEWNGDANEPCKTVDQGNEPGLVAATLTGGKPTLATPGKCINSATSFGKWYTDAPGDNATIVGELLLFSNGGNGFVNKYGTAGDGLTPTQFTNQTTAALVDGNPAFFPLDGNPLALVDTRFPAAVPPQFYGGPADWGTKTGSHNFHFTSEVLYWFTYEDDMNATLSFLGDDDLWVFVNGHLVVDLGGSHIPLAGSVTINGADVTSTSDVAGADSWTATELGLMDGNVYQIKVFQAERKVYGSSYQLTLAGFDSTRSDCRAQCGDGIIGAGEECDDGVNDGGYNECQQGCVLGGYCGDGIVQENEVCDDGDPNKPDQCSGCRILVVR